MKNRVSVVSIEGDKRPRSSISGVGAGLRSMLRGTTEKINHSVETLTNVDSPYSSKGKRSSVSNDGPHIPLVPEIHANQECDDEFSEASYEMLSPMSVYPAEFTPPSARSTDTLSVTPVAAIAKCIENKGRLSSVSDKCYLDSRHGHQSEKMKRLSEVSVFEHVVQEEVIAKSGLCASSAFPIGIDDVGPHSFRVRTPGYTRRFCRWSSVFSRPCTCALSPFGIPQKA
jgi:hypothetical protein